MRKTRRRATLTNEIRLRRLTVDEALLKLDRYLNDAFVAGLSPGKRNPRQGTGTLRQAVREQLANIPWSNPIVRAVTAREITGLPSSNCPKKSIEREWFLAIILYCRGECRLVV